MGTSPFNRWHVLFALVALVGSTATLTAAPPPGLRWGDIAFGNSSRARPAAPAQTGVFAAPATYGVYGSPAPMVFAPAVPTVSGQTIAIRGADGIIRVYPITGGVVQQLPSTSTATVQVNPGVGGTSSNPAVVIPPR